MSKEEQLDLIDVEPENKKEMLRVARKYKAVQATRIEALAAEKKEKGKLLELVREAEIAPEADGSFRFRVGNLVISVTPRDELVRCKFDDDEE